LPATDAGVPSPLDDAVTVTIDVIEKAFACHRLGIASRQICEAVVPRELRQPGVRALAIDERKDLAFLTVLCTETLGLNAYGARGDKE